MNELVKTWVTIGKKNPWIKGVGSGDPDADCAFEKPFDASYLKEVYSLEELAQKFEDGNWSLGVGFYYKNLCFINQIDGGDEWLTLKDDYAFESISMGRIIERGGMEEFGTLIEDLLSATKEECVTLEYSKKHRTA